jgi:hypothetical protein
MNNGKRDGSMKDHHQFFANVGSERRKVDRYINETINNVRDQNLLFSIIIQNHFAPFVFV